MCSVCADSLWRCFGIGAREKFSLCFVITKALLVYDVVTDFMFWNTVRDDEAVPEWAKWMVLLFACVGVVLDALGSFYICCTSSPDSWGKDEEEASNIYEVRQRRSVR